MTMLFETHFPGLGMSFAYQLSVKLFFNTATHQIALVFLENIESETFPGRLNRLYTSISFLKKWKSNRRATYSPNSFFTFFDLLYQITVRFEKDYLSILKIPGLLVLCTN